MSNATSTNGTAAAIDQAAADLGITLAYEFVPFSVSRKANNAAAHPSKIGDLSLNWRVTLRRNDSHVLTTDYTAGVGHAPSYSARVTLDVFERVRMECETGRKAHGINHISTHNGAPIVPKDADVLHCLILDSEVLEYGTFEGWAETYGMDTDSRKAEKMYRECLEIALRLRAALGDAGLQRLRVACEGY